MPDEGPFNNPPSRRRGIGRNKRGTGDRGDRDSPVPLFHNAARELKSQLRSLGQQNSLDIAGGFSNYNDRLPNSNSRGSIQGTFRQREDSVHDDQTGNVNRYI
jgi:hypothetical protein